ncbi:peptidase S41 [Tenacibaculum finnmarkense]|uniref:S41 family peptidase n=1 Tax=Tenacibaculum finnmarkense TaxID=2781243 RepID=UPI00187BA15C|nr:S41 family peptidase [Tenacibaculum finnmarkense]MBE7647662.1 peptidase S41 [Tenacibaculum finnmarkense genomovar ulcerans]MCD8400122.1 peptidase S41 [Tenacibaculum finnmarkense genomovar ulcerans]MCG8761851.1 peptidase S41 [Tenacibaculum finnmarkense]MCG8785271.1 peptidase S41 [Tenacibaculum finnmarkense]MCG8787225.1 peptidase S41 [Tenacibaculum finnmarkense]
MKLFKAFSSTFFSLFLLMSMVSCSKKAATPSDIQIQNFIWKGLNANYLWQDQVADLSDKRFTNDQELYAFLSETENPSDFFEKLLYKRNELDKWSWIVDDYLALEQSFQGTSQTTGMEFGLKRFKTNASEVFGYVRYVVSGTDADTKGIKRGMIFTQVNGAPINDKNYKELLFSNANSYTINLADYNNGDPITNATSYTLEKSVYTENPIHIAKTIEHAGQKMGYLMYNSFTANFDSELNQAFLKFKTAGIQNLIIDLRYNGGGSVTTATRLASMITGQFTGDIFAKQRWNSKYMAVLNPDDITNKFTDKISASEEINSLNLHNIYFIITESSASASELVINGLVPHINVKTVGSKTHGKYVGSITLYDSPTFSKKDINTAHNWAMQPIVLEIVNKDNHNDKEGIPPTVTRFEDFGNLGELGNKTEPLLAKTLQLISSGARGNTNSKMIQLETIGSSKSNNVNYNTMYVDLK